jgi:magnesium chelatase family protein
VNLSDLRGTNTNGKGSAAIRELILEARKRQEERFARYGSKIKTNAEMSSKQVGDLISFAPGVEDFLRTLDKTRLSPRGYYRLLKTAQTIADLEESGHVTAGHLAEAFGYRLREEI